MKTRIPVPREIDLSRVKMGLTQGLQLLDALEIEIDPDAD